MAHASKAIRQQRGLLLRGARLVLCACLACACACLCAPQRAAAYFYDVASDYGTVSELEPNGSVVDVSDIPDGEYSIEAQSSSARFAMPSDVVLTVQDGSAAISFTLSATYNYLYLGSAQQAAALSDESGTDASAYIAPTLNDDGTCRYSFAITQLNVSIAVAMFNGGKKGVADACWYDRQLLFETNDEINLAVAAASIAGEDTSGQDEQDEQQEEAQSGTDGGSEQDEEHDAEQSAATTRQRDTSDVNIVIDENAQVDDDDDVAEVLESVASARRSSTSSEESDADDAAASESAAGSVLRVNVKELGLDDSTSIDELPVAEAVSQETSVSVPPVLVAASALFLLGALLKTLLFLVGRGRPVSRKPASGAHERSLA